MIQGRCPICSKAYTIADVGELPSFPFCSERCRLVDLGRWIDGQYLIPGSPVTSQQPEGQESSSAEDVE
jgi:endogenous inhibitor of DNA gyrase (YacG/DUF329 family)